MLMITLPKTAPRNSDWFLSYGHSNIDSTIPLLPEPKISSLWPSSVAVQAGLCRAWSEGPEDRFSRSEAHIHLSRPSSRLQISYHLYSNINKKKKKMNEYIPK